ncbi:hypothetical protein [Paraburkholderia sp. CI3]|uniref:hypothetical protein n=1 Tax=Paraburkholderia sp. CI3 TaxID=2991060 RepID=UPI003D1C3DF0
MNIVFWLVTASASGALGALCGLRLRPASRIWVLLDWWWLLPAIALIGALAGGLQHIRRLEEQTFAMSQIAEVQHTLHADVMRIQEGQCGEAAVQRNAPVLQLCRAIETVAREALVPGMQSVEAISLAGELDDSCPDRCDADTVTLREDLKGYAATVTRVAPLVLTIGPDDLAEERVFANCLLGAVCLSLGLLCARLAAVSRRVFSRRCDESQEAPVDSRSAESTADSSIFSARAVKP